jgi:GDP-L-fucose synthase
VKKIFIAGHNGMVGASLLKLLKTKRNYKLFTQSKKELDLTNQSKVLKYFKKNKFDEVYIAAAKVGGIYANNNFPAQFIYINLMIVCNIVHSAYLTGTKKILFLGSSCIYPKYAKQPMQEKELLGGFLEPTNEPYAIAKIAGIKLCESYNRQYKAKNLDFRSVMPTNLYGPGDNYHPKNSHVIPALIRKVHEAKKKNEKKVIIWGSGNAKREFLFVEDLARYCLKIMNLPKKKFNQHTSERCAHINLGSGKDIKILDLAKTICSVLNYRGKLVFDRSYPDGHPRKLLNIKKSQKLGIKKITPLKVGLEKAYLDFLKGC